MFVPLPLLRPLEDRRVPPRRSFAFRRPARTGQPETTPYLVPLHAPSQCRGSPFAVPLPHHPPRNRHPTRPTLGTRSARAGLRAQDGRAGCHAGADFSGGQLHGRASSARLAGGRAPAVTPFGVRSGTFQAGRGRAVRHKFRGLPWWNVLPRSGDASGRRRRLTYRQGKPINTQPIGSVRTVFRQPRPGPTGLAADAGTACRTRSVSAISSVAAAGEVRHS